jgi:hypothetical protein
MNSASLTTSPAHLLQRCTECDADADLTRPLRDGIGHHAIERVRPITERVAV